MKKAIYCIYFQLIFLSIFTDCRLQEQFGMFGRCLLNLLTPVYLILILGCTRKLIINTYIKHMFYLLFYLIVVSLVADVGWMLTGGEIVLFGENIYIKSFKTSSYWLMITLYMTCIYLCIQYIDSEKVLKPFVITYFFLFVYLLVELYTMPYAFHIGLRAGQYYDRVMLTSTESSGTAPLIVTFGIATLIYFYHKKSRFGLGTTFGTLLVFIFTSGSKTIYLLVIASLLTIFICLLKKIKRKYVYVLSVVIILALWIVIYYFDKLIVLSVRYQGSYGIRGIQIITALYHMLRYPLGVGGGIHMITLRQSVALIYEKMRNSSYLARFVVSNWEVKEMLYGTDDSYTGIIAGMMQQSMFWGVFGTGYWLKKTYQYFYNKKNRNKFVMISSRVFYVCVIVMFFMTTGIYNQYMIFALLIVLGEKRQCFDT